MLETNYDRWKTTPPEYIEREPTIFDEAAWKENEVNEENYWQERCQFWCARYLELAQTVRPLLFNASRVDDYAELQHSVAKVEKLLRRDAHGQSND